MFTRAIVRPPAPNFGEGLTTGGLGAPDYRRAMHEHEAYCAALEQCGLTLTRLEADERYPDSCFVEDTAVIIAAPPTGALSDDPASAPISAEARSLPQAVLTNRLSPVVPTTKHAVLTRPGASSRQGEVLTMRTTVDDLFPNKSIHEIKPPGTLDGGDVCEAGNHFFIGISERTNERGAEQLAKLLAPLGYGSSFVDIRGDNSLLHLKSGLAYLGNNRLVVTEALAERPEFARFDLVRVNSKERYAANCVRVNDHVLVAAGYPTFEAQLRDLGYQVIALDMSEFQKMDGGLSCLSLRC